MSLSDVGNVADLNIDDIVDLQDFANLARCWQMEQALLPEDLDRDGTVGLIDVAVFAEHWLEVPAVPGVENFETADFSKFPWEHAGDTSWAVTSQRQHSGAYSAKAGSIGHNESTTLQVGLDCGSGNISFLRRVSCEAPRDNLKFYIDGVETATWSGEEDWAEVSFGVTAGRRTFTWTYSKSRSGSEGDDTAWIDDIVFPLRLDPPQPAGVIELTDATFDQIVLGSDVPVLVDFWATWCGPCMMMAPVIEEIAEEYAGRAKVCKIDVDDARDIPMAYGINAIPTFILFKGGQIERKWIGVTSKEELANAIDELL
jgi:thioredoxin 1